MVEREGNAKAESVNKGCLKSKDLNELIRKNINPSKSVLLTDEYRGYSKVSKILKHYTINHNYEYANGQIHTNNTIESFWALLKMDIMGQFHRVSAKHLNKYVDEFCFRFNARNEKTSNTFDCVVGNMLII